MIERNKIANKLMDNFFYNENSDKEKKWKIRDE